MVKFKYFGFIIIWIAILLSGCQAPPDNSVVIGPGSSHTNVLSLLGEPDRVQEFNLPEVPFFGPQESLTDLIPTGTPVEEWVYVLGEEELYVWFAGEEGQVKDQWQVIKTARYPVGAVY